MQHQLKLKHWVGILFLASFLCFTRFYQLRLLPASLTHDETVYAAQAASYALRLKSLNGQHRPWFLTPFHEMYAELPATVISLGFLLTDQALLATHLPSALMGILLPFIFGWLLWGIWQDKTLSWCGVLVGAASPLWWQFSRLSYDTFYSTFFYLAGGALYLNLKGRKKLWSLLPLTIGFFQYQGLKLLLVPWLLLLFALDNFKYKLTWKRLKAKLPHPPAWIIYAGLGLSLLYGLILLPSQKTSLRSQQTIFQTPQQVVDRVNTNRRLSLNSPYKTLVTNKATNTIWFMIDRFLGAFNPGLLFRYGEPNASGFAVWTHGIFYLVDGLLIIIGLITLLTQKKQRLTGIWLNLAILVFSLPDLVNTLSQWHLMRTFLAYSVLLIFISWGCKTLWQNKLWRWPLVIIYTISIAYFSYQYFYRYPVTHLDAGTFDERLASTYAGLAVKEKPQQEIFIHADTPKMTFYNYLLYEQLIQPKNLAQIEETILANEQQKIKHYRLGAVTVTNGCVDPLSKQTHIWEIGHSFCQKEGAEKFKTNRLTIPAVLDSGEQYRLHGDQLCNDYKLKSYVHLGSSSQLALDKMSVQEFCQTWLTDLRQLE